MDIGKAILQVVERENLSEDEAFEVMDFIMDGLASDAQIASFLTALRMKGETVNEITGFARAMRCRSTKVNPSRSFLVDTCGTGGDMAGTFNISTTAAFIVAACGLPVAKHGNRSVSSNSGSADVLEALGVNIDLSPREVSSCIDKIGIGFLFSPAFHPAMKHVMKARKQVGIRTVFNLLGPLANPAGARRLLMGVFSGALTEPVAEVLMSLGVERALVVHGAGGLDEISTLGSTRITEVRNQALETYCIEPEMFGIRRAALNGVRGGSPRENAQITLRILGGEPGAGHDIAVLNTAGALVAGGRASDFTGGIGLAREAVYSGEAMHKLRLLQEYTKSMAGKGGRGEGNAGLP